MPWTGSAAGSTARWPPRSQGTRRRHAAPLSRCSPGRRTAYDGCGAVVRRGRVAERLAGLGYRGRLAAMAGRGPASLTPRELDVARLAARGFTAAEIGRQLFIGTRTVETHLAHACAKLGCRSKRELPRFSAELDREPETP